MEPLDTPRVANGEARRSVGFSKGAQIEAKGESRETKGARGDQERQRGNQITL